MKTVGIITSQWFDNYGTLFQAFALQEAIRTMGYDVHIVPLTVPKSTGLRRILAPSIPKIYNKVCKFISEGGAKFQRDIEDFRRCRYLRGGIEAFDFYQAPKYDFKEDVLIFGSDNIWSVGDLPLDSKCFDVWFGKGIRHPNKVVYAASTGGYLHSHRFCSEIIKMMSDGGFGRISLREPINVETVHKAGLDEVQFAPDPTLLLGREFWDAEAGAGGRPGHEPDYVLGYDLNYHSTDIPVASLCERIAKMEGIPIRCVYPQRFIKYWKCAMRPSPAEWLKAIRDAKLVVTNSFHGVVFSIIFNTPVVFIPIKGARAAYNMRAIEFLKLFGLEDRILYNATSLHEIIQMPIRWQVVDLVKVELRRKGLTYLKECLK